MAKQVEIFTLCRGERKFVKTNRKFNKMRVSCRIKSAMSPQINSFTSWKFNVKCNSFQGNLFDLLLLNYTEKQHKDDNRQELSRFQESVFSYSAVVVESGNSTRYLNQFEVCFDYVDYIEISTFAFDSSTIESVNFQLFDDSECLEYCHTWSHIKNIIYRSNFEKNFDSEKTGFLLSGDYLNYISEVSENAKLLTENGSFSFAELSFFGNYVSYFGSTGMTLPALYLGRHKQFNFINSSMGDSQPSMNFYVY